MVVQTMLQSFRTNILSIIVAMLFVALPAYAGIGTITEQVGPTAEIDRNKTKITANKGTGLESNDVVKTAQTKLGLTFEDNTKVAVNEQSKLLIDDFVYDPNNKATGKLAMKVAMGTVRYASGAIAHNNRKAVAIKTPTATVAVRGTDFTMTVDEVGKSLIILLPSCPDPKKPDECFTGEIEVSTDVGSVLMNQAFQATAVASASMPPTKPTIVNIKPELIDNTLILSPPYEFRTAVQIDQAKEVSELDVDLLDFKDLMEDLLASEDTLKYSKLDINMLEQNFLDNFFSIMSSGLNEDALAEKDGVLPNIKSFVWIQSVYNEETIFMRSERPPHIAEFNGTRDLNGTVNLTQDGVQAAVQVNAGGTNVVINITQSQ